MTRTESQPRAEQSKVDGPVFQDIARFRGILFDRVLKPHNLTMSQGWVILHLMHENGLRQADLAARMDVATVTVSKLIDRLAERGFVERCADRTDRRTNRIFATQKAQAMLRTMRAAQREVDALARTGIDPAALEITMNVLSQMRENLKAALHESQ